MTDESKRDLPEQDDWYFAKLFEDSSWELMHVEGDRALHIVAHGTVGPASTYMMHWRPLEEIFEWGKIFKQYEQEYIELQNKVAAFDGQYTVIDDNPTLIERTAAEIIEQATRSDKNLWGRQLRVMGILGSFEKGIRVDERHEVSSEILRLQEEIASIQKLADRRLRERDAERAQIDALRAALDLKMGEGLSLEEITAHVKALGITGDHIKATALQVADAVEQEKQRALAEQVPRGRPYDNYGCWEIQDDDGNHVSWMWGAVGTPSEEDIREGDEDPLTLDEMTEAIAAHRAAVAASCFPEMSARIAELQKQNSALGAERDALERERDDARRGWAQTVVAHMFTAGAHVQMDSAWREQATMMFGHDEASRLFPSRIMREEASREDTP